MTTVRCNESALGEHLIPSFRIQQLFSIFSNPLVCHYFVRAQSVINPRKDDVTRDDFQRRFLVQHWVQMLEQCCSLSKRCRNNVVTLCCAKNRRCKPSRVT